MSPSFPGNKNAILFTLLECPCHGLLTFHHIPTNTCRRLGNPCHSVPGALPPANPAGYVTCHTLAGDCGAPASAAMLVVEFHRMSQPSPVNDANPLSATTVAPAGSCGQAPLGGGSAVTVSVAVPSCPSAVAVIAAVPATSAVASPLPDTVATVRLLELQLTVRPDSTLPVASRSVAVNCCVPSAPTLALAGLRVTEATGCGAPAAVVPVATFDSAPNTASTLSVPRNATTWKPYAVDPDNPCTVHVRCAPIVLPRRGVAHVPPATLVAEPQEIGDGAERTS